MGMAPRPIDYDAVRKAIVIAVRLATGLDSQHVVVSEPESADAPKPSLPYITIQFVEAGTRYGRDYTVADGDDTIYAGPRSVAITFNSFSATHEECAGLMELWQASLEIDDTRSILAGAGIAVWRPGTVMSLAELYAAGYQPRSYMQVIFGATSILRQSEQSIGSVGVSGPIGPLVVDGDATDTVTGGAAVITVRCQPTDAVGSLVCVTSDGTVSTADCMNGALVPAIGFIIAKPGDTSATVQLNGALPDGIVTGLVAGKTYILGAAGSVMFGTFGGAQYFQPVGVALSATQMIVQLQPLVTRVLM